MYKAKSFAKINLGLEILNKRNDGFHSIKTIMTKISLFDEIDIRKSSKNSVIQDGIDEENNLVTKILNFMQDKYFDENHRELKTLLKLLGASSQSLKLSSSGDRRRARAARE